ncbi:MAG: UDP-N-acetylglucosamine 1-carboxyvinyltransferase, partial [Syntrophothermus sp.]
GFTALGARISMGYGYVEAWASQLQGARICLDYPSVGATENLMMGACLARGTTVIENAAAEPEVGDLAALLNAMGGRISGAGSPIVTIEGVSELKGAKHRIIPDRIEAGTYLTAAAITGGRLRVENVISQHLEPVLAKLREAGFTVEVEEDGGAVTVSGAARPAAVDVKTMPYPGFPTDLQPQMLALMTLSEGISLITENVFENRFMHVDELKRMGAHIRVQGRTAVVEGVPGLTGAPVKATDLRAGAALVLAGLAARGQTEISYVHHIDRGYVEMEKTLKRLGAKIQRYSNQEVAFDAAVSG